MEKKVVAIQQPEHLPWLGFFDKMKRCHEYIYLDNVQFKKRYFENRNRILTEQDIQWVTVPVKTKGKYHQYINEVLIDDEKPWRRKYLGIIQRAYAKSPEFERYYGELTDIISRPVTRLVDLNIMLIDWIRTHLEITTPVRCASDIRGYHDKGSDLILAICKDTKADVYISGPDGRNYLDFDAFAEERIEVVFHEYHHPVYRQMSEPFQSHMSIIDILFCGQKDQIAQKVFI
ncbi:MAG: WbqC family protein [Candidatus Omnitrophica bacterium]|nr:WbqC family protein [Candidatus Omnitrophota bacterium]